MKELNNMDEQKKLSPESSAEQSIPSNSTETRQMNSKKPLSLTIGIILALLILIGGYLLFSQYTTKNKIASIKSFEDCKKAGYPILEMYLPSCKTPDGRSFTDTSQITPSTITKSSPKPTKTKTPNFVRKTHPRHQGQRQEKRSQSVQ